jgi:hypothetical protein
LALGPRKGLVAILKTELLLAHASWIGAEIPQDLHRQIRGIEAESPVFYHRIAKQFYGKKCAQILLLDLPLHRKTS